MLNELTEVMGNRVREVLRSHFEGTPEEINTATVEIMKELATVGSNLENMLESGEGVNNLIGFGGENSRQDLTDQLTKDLPSQNSVTKIVTNNNNK